MEVNFSSVVRNLAVCVLFAFVLSACGATGDLTMPEKDKQASEQMDAPQNADQAQDKKDKPYEEK